MAMIKPAGDVWLGLDLGTQSVRAMLVSGDGTVLGAGSHPLTSRRDGATHEQNPEDWWQAATVACRQAFAAAPAGIAVGGVAVDATSGTVLLIDVQGQALTPGLMYDDTRATSEVRRANEVGAAQWTEQGYNRMQPSWGLPKLLWLLSHHGDLPTGARLSHQSDFINRRLVGTAVATDTSNALKTGVDLVAERWPSEVFASLGVLQGILPPVVRAGTLLGTVCPQAAAATGIPSGTPVIAGMTDGCAAQIAAGALGLGSWNVVLGTTLVLKGVTSELIKDPGGVVYSHRSPDGNWLPGGASSTGAGGIAKEFPGANLDALAAEAAGHEPASVVTYPLHARGERFPFIAPEAEGFSLGRPTGEVDRYAALLQGVAFIERLCFDYLDLLGAPMDGPRVLTGGGAKSRYWCQLRADVSGRPVTLPESTEAAFGMAVLAASAGRSLGEVAGEMVRVRETIEPRSGHTARFHEPYMKLVNELARRGWLPEPVAEHARRRTAQ